MIGIVITIVTSAASAIPAGFLFTFVPRIFDAINKAGKKEPEISSKKIMSRLDDIDKQMELLSQKLGVQPDNRWG